jgi:phosphatidylserine decarboxylase
MKYRLAKEAFIYLIPLWILMLLSFCFISQSFALFLFLMSFFLLNFFRMPVFVLTPKQDEIYCPAWGKVTSILEIPEAPGIPAHKKVSIFLNVFDVHGQTNPCDGVVQSVHYEKGKFLNAMDPDSGDQNEKNTLCIQKQGSNDRIEVVQIAGLIARRIRCFVKEKDALKAGEYFGLIQFGSRVEVRMPQSTQVLVTVGERVYGPRTVLGKLP